MLPPLSGLVFILTVMPNISLADFGRYSLIFAIAVQISLFTKNLILNPMIKIAAEPGRFETTSSIGFWLAGAVQLFAFLLLATVSSIGERIFRLERHDLLIAGAIPIAFWVRDWGFSVQQAAYQTSRLFWIEAVYWGGTAIGFVWFFMRGMGTVGEVFTIIFVCAALSSLYAIILWPNGRRFSFRIDLPTLKELLRYGFYTVGLGLSSSLLAGADLIVLGAIYNSEIVGIYSGAKRVYMVVAALISTVGLLVIPYASKLAADNRKAEVRALFEKIVVYMAVGMTIAVGIGWFLAAPFYHSVMPEAYGNSIPLFRILLLAAPFEGLFYITAALLYGIGSAKITVTTSGYALGLLILSLPAGAYFFGVTGAALSQVTVTAFVGILMTWRAGRNVGSDFRSTLGRLSTGLRGVWLRFGAR